MRVIETFFLSGLLGIVVAGCDQANPPSRADAPGAVAPDGVRTSGNATALDNPAAPNNTAAAANTAARNNTAAPDNTAVNQRDRDASAKTPIDQKENQTDVNLTARIRREILDTKDLSIDARNAKVITADGKVTLRGPVKSDAERDTLERIARQVAGDGNVDNQLEVAATATTNP